MENIDLNDSGSMILEEEIEEGYEPSKEDILEYAKFLGMDLNKDQKFLYLAKEGLKAPLPEPWKPYKNSKGHISYINIKTKEFVTEHPCDIIYKQKFQELKKKENSHIDNEKQLELANKKINKQIDQQKIIINQQQQQILKQIDNSNNPLKNSNILKSQAIKPQKDILDKIHKNQQVLTELKQMVDQSYNLKIYEINKQKEQEVSQAQMKINIGYLKEEDKLRKEYEQFVNFQKENKKFNQICKQKQDKQSLEIDIKQQQLTLFKQNIDSMQKQYQIEKSAMLINIKNHYVNVLEKDQVQIQQKYENQMNLLHLKIKQTKTLINQKQKQVIIQQEQVRILVENQINKEYVQNYTQKIQQYTQQIEKRQQNITDEFIKQLKQEFINQQERLEIENGVKFTQKDKMNLDEIFMMKYKLQIKELTQKYIEKQQQDILILKQQSEQIINNKQKQIYNQKIVAHNENLQQKKKQEKSNQIFNIEKHRKNVQQKYEVIKNKIRNQIQTQKINLQNQILQLEQEIEQLEKDNKQKLNCLFNKNIENQSKQFFRSYKPVKKEIQKQSQQQYFLEKRQKYIQNRHPKSFNEFMNKTEKSLSQMVKEIHDIKFTLQNNLEQLSNSKKDNNLNNSQVFLENNQQNDQNNNYKNHRIIQQKFQQSLDEANINQNNNNKNKNNNYKNFRNNIDLQIEEKEENNLSSNINNWLQLTIQIKRDLREQQNKLHNQKQEINDLTEQVRYCQFRYNEEKQRSIDHELMQDNQIKNKIMSKIQNNIQYLNNQITEKTQYLKNQEIFQSQKEQAFNTFEQKLDQMVEDNVLNEDELQELFKMYDNIKISSNKQIIKSINRKQTNIQNKEYSNLNKKKTDNSYFANNYLVQKSKTKKQKERQQSLTNNTTIDFNIFNQKNINKNHHIYKQNNDNNLQNYYVKNNVSFNIQNNKQVVGEILKDQSDWLKNVKQELSSHLFDKGKNRLSTSQEKNKRPYF